MKTAVPIADLRLELEAWQSRLCRAAERWVHAHAAGLDTSELDAEQRRCEREVRRLERRIKRRAR